MLGTEYEIPEAFLENEIIDQSSDEEYRFWICLIDVSIQNFKENPGIFKYPWKILSQDEVINIYNAVSRYPIFDKDKRNKMFNRLLELKMIEKNSQDKAYFIEAAFFAKKIL